VQFCSLLALIVLTPALPVCSSQRTYMVPMSDGVRLATDVYLPEGDGPWPTILARTPYGRFKIDELTARGYAVVTQDWRGYGWSEGEKMPFEAEGWGEHRDGYDTARWIIDQNWSNGLIGTWGGSALGISQNLMAGSYPPGLVCQHILAAADDLYSQMFFQGGVFRKSLVEGWWSAFGNQQQLLELLSHPNYDSRWRLLNCKERVSNMTYPAIHIGGWFDIFSQGTIDSFVTRQHLASAGSRGNQILIMGPWWHGGMGSTVQGDLTFPENSLYPELWPDTIRFYDHWLKGKENGVEDDPPVRYYVMGDVENHDAPGNEWRSARDWPVPHVNLSLYLSSHGLVKEPGPDEAISYLYDPRDPVPTVGGANLILPAGPRDQRQVETRDDVIVFSTPPLEVPVEVTGRIYVQLFAESSCPDTDFMAKLTDVYPDGRSILLLDGAIRASHRISMERIDPLERGEVYEFWIDLWSTSIVFDKGHRIRLDITSSNAPRFLPNPNTGSYPFSEETCISNNTIHMGRRYPSRIILPIAGPDSDGDGTYDYLDPAPEDAGPSPDRGELLGDLQFLESQIESLGLEQLRSTLEAALDEAKHRLQQGDLAGTGHLAGLVRRALQNAPRDWNSSDAELIYESWVGRAASMTEKGRYAQMGECIAAGRSLADLADSLEDSDSWPILRGYVDTFALDLSCHDALRLSTFLGRPDVAALASRIERCREQGMDATQLSIVQGMLESSINQFVDWRLPNAESLLDAAGRKLDQLGTEVGQKYIVAVILVVLLLSRRTSVLHPEP